MPKRRKAPNKSEIAMFRLNPWLDDRIEKLARARDMTRSQLFRKLAEREVLRAIRNEEITQGRYRRS